jgi:DNA-binding XRE family transcriptional regulator
MIQFYPRNEVDAVPIAESHDTLTIMSVVTKKYGTMNAVRHRGEKKFNINIGGVIPAGTADSMVGALGTLLSRKEE